MSNIPVWRRSLEILADTLFMSLSVETLMGDGEGAADTPVLVGDVTIRIGVTTGFRFAYKVSAVASLVSDDRKSLAVLARDEGSLYYMVGYDHPKRRVDFVVLNADEVSGLDSLADDLRGYGFEDVPKLIDAYSATCSAWWFKDVNSGGWKTLKAYGGETDDASDLDEGERVASGKDASPDDSAVPV